MKSTASFAGQFIQPREYRSSLHGWQERKKVTLDAARIKPALESTLEHGNFTAKRDWGFALGYCEGMWKMLQLDHPDDFVLATGETHTVREFVEIAYGELDLKISWQGKGADEKGINKKTGKTLIVIDPAYYRPTEVDLLIGDETKAREKLGWVPRTKFQDLVRLMVRAVHDKVARLGF